MNATPKSSPTYRVVGGRYVFRGPTCVAIASTPESAALIAESLNGARRPEPGGCAPETDGKTAADLPKLAVTQGETTPES